MKLIMELNAYLDTVFPEYYKQRIEHLSQITLNDLVTNIHVYPLATHGAILLPDLIKNLLDAYLQSQEETLFGNFLEGIAIFVCQKTFGGAKSRALVGIDLEFYKDGVYYIIEIKSGPNWGNSSQIKKMKDNFNNAKHILLQQNPTLQIVAVNGCCYGVDNKPDKGDYQKICGQAFWELISDNDTLYIDIVEPLGHKAQENNEAYFMEYYRRLNEFTVKFSQAFCDNYQINWHKLIAFNSGKKIKAAKVDKSQKKANKTT
jgi:hypothetical protein